MFHKIYPPSEASMDHTSLLQNTRK